MSDDGENLQFTITGRDHRRLKTWANIIATGAALAVGIATALKPQDPVGKNSYDELKQAIERNEKSIAQNHEDVAAIRAFLDGYMKGSSAPPPPSSSSAHPWTAKSTSKPEGAGPSAPAPPLPSLHPKPESQKLPEYGDLK